MGKARLNVDTQRALDFLSRWCSDRPRHLAAIKPTGVLIAKTFFPSVRHRMIWHRLHAELAECPAHLVGHVRRRICDDASAVD